MNKFFKVLGYKGDTSNENPQLKLIRILHEYLNLRIQLRLGELKQCHLLKKSRRDIASIKFNLSSCQDENESHNFKK